MLEFRWTLLLLVIFFFAGCISDPEPVYPVVDRYTKLPSDIAKQGPETDLYPPILYSEEFEEPVPAPGELNTSGGEDSPFILPCGNQMYFFFTPDVRIPVEEQLLDSVSGTWLSIRIQGVWTKAERIWLNDPDVLSMDGAVSIQGDEMWFASAREGYTGVNNFTAERVDGKWTNWQYAGDRIMKELRVGETHIHGDDLYYHSDLEGGKGDLDIWKTTRSQGEWSDPVNIDAVNSEGPDGWPYVNEEATELWFTRTYLGTPAIFRSKWASGEWSEPELIVSQFAGEPTLDKEGNLYFTHHFFDHGEMIEGDIYVAFRK
jgi:hypothetical protein